MRNSSFPMGISTHIRVHMKLTSDMEAARWMYIAVKHMHEDTQTRTPTDVLADLIDD